MHVRPRAEASAPCLDPEEVAEHGDDVVRVQRPAPVPDAERDDREPLDVRVAEDLDVRVAAPGLERATDEALLSPADLVGPYRFLEREDEPGADRLDDGRRAGLLANLRVGVVRMARRAHEQDRPAAGHGRDGVAKQGALRDEHAGRPGAADELVR